MDDLTQVMLQEDLLEMFLFLTRNNFGKKVAPKSWLDETKQLPKAFPTMIECQQ